MIVALWNVVAMVVCSVIRVTVVRLFLLSTATRTAFVQTEVRRTANETIGTIGFAIELAIEVVLEVVLEIVLEIVLDVVLEVVFEVVFGVVFEVVFEVAIRASIQTVVPTQRLLKLPSPIRRSS